MERKESTLEVLFYLFENYSDVDDVSQNRDVLHGYLNQAGFPNPDIHRAFDWLESLADEEVGYIAEPNKRSVRIFSESEIYWLNSECRSYLIFLDHVGVLSAEMRERTIDRVLELQDACFNLDKLKWVILMLLLNQPNSEAAYVWMDEIALTDQLPQYH
jgi:Smg protein